MFIIVRGSRSGKQYLCYDSSGRHHWSDERLDSIRFELNKDVLDSCAHFLASGGKVKQVDDWDGHYESYHGYEIQIFAAPEEGEGRGKTWKYRIGPLGTGRAFIYTPAKKGYLTSATALKAAQSAVVTVERAEDQAQAQAQEQEH